MRFETLKTNRRKKYLIGIIVFIAVMSTISLVESRAKYRTTQSIKIVEGTIRNYSPSDFSIVAIKLQNENGDYIDSETIPESGYKLNTTESYCTMPDGTGGTTTDSNITMEYKNGRVFIGFSTKGTKCYLYFDEQSGITILANIDGVSSSSFPTKTAGYTPTSISCTNNAKAKFDYVDWAVEVDNVEETSCTVDFKTNKTDTFATYLKNKVCSSTPTNNDAAKDCLVNENGYRYEGANPNNYVLYNDELWRIIGVFTVKNSSGTSEDLVKLIRNETLDGLAWDGSNTNDWSAATLKTQLNGGYLNGTDTTCNFYSTITKTCYFSETGLNSTARGMIENVVWNLGGYSSTSVTAEAMYGYERGTTVSSGRPTTWTGQVALMYPSDYGYAVLASSCARTTNLGSYDTTACAGNNWLKTDSFQWTLTSRPSSSVSIFLVYYTGYVTSSATANGHGARPSIYLKSSIKILGGLGTRDVPYIIK